LLCYRCGSHVPDGSEVCGNCGQRFDTNVRGGKTGVLQKRKLSELESAGVKIGEVLAGRYEVRSMVGQGPVGSVLRALDKEVDVEIGLKLIAPRLLQSPDERAEFNKLLKQAKKLSHPNIVRVYEIGSLDGEGSPSQRPFFTMQLLDGLTLRRVIDLRREKNQLFALREVEPILAQVALALEHARQFGPHGDIKPENIIVLPDLLKVTDFGLAPAIPRAPFIAAQKARKTDVYLAPEFLGGHPIDSRSDVYSMGVILGEMVSGQLPASGRVPDLRTGNPELPPAVEALYRRCLAANAESRYPSASELAAELLSLAETTAPPLPKSVPPSAPPVKAPTPPAAGVVVSKSLPPVAPIAPPAKPKPRPPPPPESSDSFEVNTDVDEKFEPPTGEIKPKGSPATVVERRAETKPSRIARPLPTAATTGSIPIDPPPPPVRSKPRPPPPPPPVAETAGSGRWVVLAAIATVVVGVGLYGGRLALQSWKADQKRQLEEQIRKEEREKLLAVQFVDAGAAVDAGSPAVVAAVPDAGPKPTAPVAATGPAAPSGPVAPSGPAVVNHPHHEDHVVVAHESTPASCPDGMRLVRAGTFRMGTPGSDDLGNFGDRPERRVSVHSYCIDAYEYPNHADGKPQVGTNFSGAETACASQGKRLCSEEEWEKACKGPDNLRFPYGQSYSSGSCNSGKGGVAPSGSYGSCKSGYGVYDMSGNAAEWTSTRFASGVGDRTVKGGSYLRSDTDLRCSARQNKSPGSHSGDLGFRCCTDFK
jgi:serine/threonine protein kinase/formylglycine-generating enzyme required for sulfatase activity